MAHEFFRTLEKDHEEVKDLLEQLENTSESAVKTKETIFNKLKLELIPHMKGEEKRFYPLLVDKKSAHKVALESLEEHHVSELVLKELDELGKGEANWSAKLQVFKELIEHHIEEEEEEVFDAAEDSLSEEQLDDILVAFNDEKTAVKKKIAK